MTVIHRRLFWKVYLTLLSSLVVVAVLMGSLWWLLGETPRERWGAFRIHLTDQLVPKHDEPPGIVAEAIRRLGEEISADISVYAADGTLIATYGRRIHFWINEGDVHREPRHILRFDLPDGRAVLARLRPMPGEPGLRILTAVIIVAGGVGLAAFPMTARLTRRLESLRSGMARWGEGALSTRVDETGSDEVAVVARTFNSAAERLQSLLVSQKALLANASHELRSPLGRLRIAIELWMQDPAVDIKAEILRNLEEVDALVEEILLSSRLDHAPAAIDRAEEVDLLGLAAEEAVRFGASVEGSPIEIVGNPTLLRRLLRNLLENGSKHGRPPIHVMVSRERDQACIVVSDHGQGIRPEERERVFEPFYRPAGRSESAGGWGLGLSLVRQIAAKHGGKVECETSTGGGSRFVVHLATRRAAETRAVQLSSA